MFDFHQFHNGFFYLRIVEKPPKDRRSQVASELDRNKPGAETNLYRNNKEKNDETEHLTKTPDKLQDRIGNRYSDITYKSHQNIRKNIESSMLKKLMRYSVKTTLPLPKSRNLFEDKQKLESNMPVFPNFPQTLENNLSKVKHPLVEKSTIMDFAPLERSKVLPPKQRTYLKNFVNDRDNELFDFGSKLFLIKNSSSAPRPPRSSPFRKFSSRPFEIIANKSHQPRKSLSKKSMITPTLAPMFSITPFIWRFDGQDGGGLGGQVRREIIVTSPPTIRTTQKMDYQIFKEHFPDIEIKKITS